MGETWRVTMAQDIYEFQAVTKTVALLQVAENASNFLTSNGASSF